MKIKHLIFVLSILAMLFVGCDNKGVDSTSGDELPDEEPVEEENENISAFPGAEGFGMKATGGRGGRIFFVTNHSDDLNEGSLRYAINSPGPRYILFRVSGTIELKSPLRITNGDVTIAGQTAPGEGITLRNHTVSIDADNVIIRFMRFRMGDTKQSEDDALGGRRHKNIMIDHCSLSWSTDECGSFYDNENFTLQWCILSESLRNSVHDKGTHGYGGIWGGQQASFHHNLLAHHDSRNPRFCGSRYSAQPDKEIVDFRNNVIYNWGSNSGYGGEGGSYNIVGNYYKPGPATKASVKTRIFQPNADNGSNSQPVGVWGKFYVAGNYMDGSPSVTDDNWLGIFPNPSTKSENELKSDLEFEKGTVNTHTATDAYTLVLNHAGASLVRDTVDKRIVYETGAGEYTYTGSNGSANGLIDTQADVGGWPELNSGETPTDTDNDGIPNEWETSMKLDPNKANATGNDLSTDYDNIEVYMNGLVKEIMEAQK